MSTNAHKNNPALSLWQKVIIDGRVHKLAREFREKLKMPSDGFSQPKDYIGWYKKHEKDSNTEKLFGGFIEASKNIIPYEGIIDDNNLDTILLDLLCSNNTDYDYFDEIKHSGIEVEIIKDGRIFYPGLTGYTPEMEDGVYIKLGHFSKISNISTYIENNKPLIRKKMALYATSENLIKAKNIKAGIHFERDGWIVGLDDLYTKKELEDNFNIIKEYKHDAIGELMKRLGFKRVNGNIVRGVIERRELGKKK